MSCSPDKTLPRFATWTAVIWLMVGLEASRRRRRCAKPSRWRRKKSFALAGVGSPRWPAARGRALDIGPLLYRETLDLEKPASAFMFPAVFVNEGIRLEVALRLMKRAGQRMAIVLSRERAEIGIVAVKDILKVMFGEMKL